MDFGSIIGQSEVIRILKHSLSNERIGHAYIFSGLQGMGKRTVAGIFAGFLLCSDPGPDKTCGSCRACLLYDNGTNPDFHMVKAEGASIGVDEIRDIQGDVTVRPMYSKHKVYIIEDADKMTVQAQNCLLKTFEEPPPYVVIILTTSRYDTLLETIRSRSQKLSFKKYTAGQVRQAVENVYGEIPAGAEAAVNYSDGVIGTALQLAGNEDFTRLRDRTIDMVSGFPLSIPSDIFKVSGFLEENRENIQVIMDTMLLYYRDLLVAKVSGNENMLINPDKKDIILNNVRYCSLQRLFENIRQVMHAQGAIKQNANFQLVLDNMLLKLQEE